MVSALVLAGSGRSTNARLLFQLFSLSEFSTLVIIEVHFRSLVFVWHCGSFPYIPTLLWWGVARWYLLPQLPIEASAVIVGFRDIIIGIGALRLVHLGRYSQPKHSKGISEACVQLKQYLFLYMSIINTASNIEVVVIVMCKFVEQATVKLPFSVHTPL